jgi:hypothetical protein
MAAITKAFTAIADAAIDPDSPITTGLMTALRDNAIHLREWLGASYYAGAVQDHDHDGVNSARIEIGPNLLRNGSFESGTSSWTLTAYTGGSYAVSTSQRAHGAQSMAFTSTVLANGGGEAVSAAHIPIGGGDTLGWKAWVWASTANVSSKVEAIWYDEAMSQITAMPLYSVTNTPTVATRQKGTVEAPAAARYVRLRVVGGVPATGSATGTVYVDGVQLTDQGVVDQAGLHLGAVGQAQLKTAEGSVSWTTYGGVRTLPGGAYGFWPRMQFLTGGGSGYGYTISVDLRTGLSGGIAVGSYIYAALTSGQWDDETLVAYQRYVQSSPPYDLGNGQVPLFVFALVERSTGRVLGTYVAEDPPWANNGPTDTRAHMTDSSGRQWRYETPERDQALEQYRAGRLAPEELDAALAAQPRLVEVTQDLKQRDMTLIPHPFPDLDPATQTVVLLDPVGQRAELLHRLARAGEDVASLVSKELVIEADPLDAITPPGVQAAGWRFKNSRTRG